MVITAQDTKLKPGYKQTEVGVIPEDWRIVDYVSIGKIIDGDRMKFGRPLEDILFLLRRFAKI